MEIKEVIQWLFREKKTVSFMVSEHGLYYAKLASIPASVEGDASPLLRRILKELGSDEIKVTEGEGGVWWDFEFQGTKFTCDMLVARVGGSELYPASCTKANKEERTLLKKLAEHIDSRAKKLNQLGDDNSE